MCREVGALKLLSLILLMKRAIKSILLGRLVKEVTSQIKGNNYCGR